jgi:hypothetical protein
MDDPSAYVPVARTAQEAEDAREQMQICIALLYRKIVCCYEMGKAYGSGVEHSPSKFFGSMFDAAAIHAQIPSNIEPNYHQTCAPAHDTCKLTGLEMLKLVIFASFCCG